MKDIEIARNTELKKIYDNAKEIGLYEDDIELYGKYVDWRQINEQF